MKHLSHILDVASTVIATAFVVVVMAGAALFCCLLALIFAPAHFAAGVHRSESPGPRGEWYGYGVVLLLAILASMYWPGVWGA